MDFDVETAIKVCRQAGYYKHALFLANRHHLHEWYLKIELDDIKDYGKALEYIGRLEFEAVNDFCLFCFWGLVTFVLVVVYIKTQLHIYLTSSSAIIKKTSIDK